MIDVIALAKQAGFESSRHHDGKECIVDCDGNDIGSTLERFAQLVAEECVQVCREKMIEFNHSSCGQDDYYDGKTEGARDCAAAIRAKFAAKEPS